LPSLDDLISSIIALGATVTIAPGKTTTNNDGYITNEWVVTLAHPTGGEVCVTDPNLHAAVIRADRGLTAAMFNPFKPVKSR
jgi:hypothetical protein